MTASLNKTFPDSIIRASAGTGKTFQLSNRYLGLLRTDVQPDQILASTFARKAAGEILERVLLRLADAAATEAGRKKLEGELALGELSREECANRLEQMVRQLHRLRIGTLDSFFIKTAGSFSLEFGLPGGWTILEDLDDRQLKLEAIRRLLRSEAKSSGNLPTLIGLLQKGDSARDIIDGLLSTVDDFYGLFMESASSAWLGEPHRPERTDEEVELLWENLAAAVLPADKRFEKAHQKALDCAAKGEWLEFLQTGLAKATFPGDGLYYKKELPADLQAVYQPLIDHAVAVLFNRILHQNEATFHLLEKYHAIYGPLKLQRHALRFDDVTRILADNLENAPLPQVEFRLDASVQHLLLDEFQDTSRLQWQVLRRFAHDVNDRPEKTFFCVGDVKQAIYGWRGGVSEIFDSVAADLHDLTALPLDRSFRSSPTIIEFVNRVYATLSQNPSLARWPEVCDVWRQRFQSHSTARTELAGYCEIRTYPAKGEQGVNQAERARVIAEYVAELHAQHPGCSIGVLTRTNAAVGRVIHALRNPKSGTREPVYASEEGGNPLTDSACVIYILSAMKLAGHPGDLVARFNVAHSPLAKCFDVPEGQWRDAFGAEVSRRIRHALLRDGYGRTIERWVRQLAHDCDERELNRLNQLVELSYRYETRATLDPTEFVRFIEETKVESPSSSLVRVMTVHQSKGLQFDLVVLPELEAQYIRGSEKYLVERSQPTEPISRVLRYFSQDLEPYFPESLRNMHAAHQRRIVNEALCVLYVALTRAVHALHILVPAEGKPENATSARLVLNAVEAAATPPDDVVFQLGDPDWFDLQAAEPVETGADRTETKIAPAIELAPPGPVRRRNLNYVTPSTQGAHRLTPDTLQPEEVSLSRSRGSLIHAWCEQIEWLDDGLPAEEQLTKVAGRFLRPGLDLGELLKWFGQKLDSGDFTDNLSASKYRSKIVPKLFPVLLKTIPLGELQFEVLRERRLTFRNGNDLVNGTADRLILIRHLGQVVAADVIDFKTDTVNTENDVESLREAYAQQLSLYRLAVESIYRVPKENISARLAFVSASRVISVG